MSQRLNRFKNINRRKSNKRKKLQKPKFILATNTEHCWIAFLEYGKVNISSADKMLRITVSKKGGKSVQHMTCKYDKWNNFRVYYSCRRGVNDVTYKFALEGNDFIRMLLKSVCNANHKENCSKVTQEYNKRFENIFCGEDSLSMTNEVWKLIYPFVKFGRDKSMLKAKLPEFILRAARNRNPKEMTRLIFSRSPKTLTKAVIKHLPLDKHSIGSLFLAKIFYGIWPLEKVVEFLEISADKTHANFIFENSAWVCNSIKGQPHRYITTWRKLFKQFTPIKVLNWYKKYPEGFGHFTYDALFQMKELEKRGYSVTLSKKMDIKEIHDNVSRYYSRLRRQEIALPVYDSLLPLKDEKIDDYDIVFPKTSYDLVEWGKFMHICVGSYDHYVEKGRSVIFSLQKNALPEYCVEFRPSADKKNFTLSQCNGKSNVYADDELRSKVKKTLESVLKDSIIKKPKLIYPDDHKVKDITQHIDLGSLGQIQKIEMPTPRLPRYRLDAHVVVPAADVIIDNDLDL